MGAPVIHFEVTGKDGKKLQQFYAKLFDWEIDANNPMEYGMVHASGKGIGGGVGPAGQGSSGVTFYVQVADLDAYLKKAESLGGKKLGGPTKVDSDTTLAWLADPEGHRIGLVKGM